MGFVPNFFRKTEGDKEWFGLAVNVRSIAVQNGILNLKKCFCGQQPEKITLVTPPNQI